MSEIMYERRKEKRVEEFNDITMKVISRKDNLLKRNVFYNCSENISESGVRIYSNNYFPVDTLLIMDIKLDNTQQMITTMGKVRWFKTVFENEWYEGGIEFVETPDYMIIKLSEHMKSLLRSNS